MRIKQYLGIVATALSVTVVQAETEGSSAEVNWLIETGVGYESNAYHAPDHSYVDWAADPTGATTVTPDEQAGAFVPLKIEGEMKNRIDATSAMIASYRFKGAFYPDKALSDAGYSDHKFKLGLDSEAGKKANSYVGVVLQKKNKVYVDRDSGDPKVSTGGGDVSNRYSYMSVGVEGDYERKLSAANSVGIKGEYTNRNYDDPVAWSQYDHTSMKLGTYWEHRITKGMKFNLGINSEVERYTERRAYSADGSLPGTNPTLRYNFFGIEAGLRHRFSPATVAYVDYEMLQRRDNHVGYNDMDQGTIKVRLIHDINDQLRLRAKARSYTRDYANALNFEDPAQGAKSASGSSLQLRGEYLYSDKLEYYLEGEGSRIKNSDDRYQYNNNVFLVGAAWRF
ncbi:MAG: hypothetical protein OEZ16_00510 [Chromatiales bacterium]|nr:hypothetical protein [Chromatiales bacterium]